MIRTYSELVRIDNFEDRYRYLKLNGVVGLETFGFDRYLNQRFYKDQRWRHVRDQVIVRDNGCDLGIKDREIFGKVLVHHMNPITISDILNETDFLFNPDYLICTSKSTHDAIHYGDEEDLFPIIVERKPNDTCPWKH